MVTDAQLVAHLHQIISGSDLDTTTATCICRRIEADLGVDLSQRRMFIVAEIDRFLHGHDAVNEFVFDFEQEKADEEQQQKGDEVVRNDTVQGDIEHVRNEGDGEGEAEKKKKRHIDEISSDYISNSGVNNGGSKRKTRGPYNMKSLCRQSSTEGSCILQFNDDGTVIGPDKKTKAAFSNYIGRMTREKIPDFVTDWRHIELGLKDTLWENIKRQWRLPESPAIKAKVLKKAGELRKNWKNKFNKQEKAKGSSLSEEYEYIDQAGLAAWKEYKATSEFQRVSEKARQSQSHNIYPHNLGSLGYQGKMMDWANEDPLDKLVNFPEDLRPFLLTGNERTKNFIRARTTKGADENYYIGVDAIRELAEVVARLHKQQNQGKFVPVRHHDALSSAIGKPDHPGRVRGVGKCGTIRSVFGNPSESSRGRYSGGISIDQKKVDLKAEVKKKVMEDLTVELKKIVAEVTEDVKTEMMAFLSQMCIQMPPMEQALTQSSIVN